MALGIVVAFNNDNQSPGFELDLSGLTGFTTYQVIRTDMSGAPNTYADAPVRGADGVSVVGDTTSVTDYETPMGVAVRYTLRGYVSGVLTSSVDSSTVTITQADVDSAVDRRYFWIKNVQDPSLSRSVSVSDFSDISYEPTILGTSKVLGRRNPIVFTDVWGARSGAFETLAIVLNGSYTTPPYELEELLQSGDVLLFQSILNSQQVRDMYFIVMGLDRNQYVGPDPSERDLEYTYSIRFQEVDQPNTAGLATGYGTWQDLKDDSAYATWADVIADNATWEDVLNRYTA